MIMDDMVTLAVPRMSAHTPKRGVPREVGYQWGVNKNFWRSNFPRIGAASRKTKKKMAKTKIMELIPQRRISVSIVFSPSTAADPRRLFTVAGVDGLAAAVAVPKDLAEELVVRSILLFGVTPIP
jgi:hypothetical protein